MATQEAVLTEHSYEECISHPHPCMKHKLRYWREGGIVGVAPVPPEWGGPTVRERVADMMERSKVNGYEPEYVGRKTLI